MMPTCAASGVSAFKGAVLSTTRSPVGMERRLDAIRSLSNPRSIGRDRVRGPVCRRRAVVARLRARPEADRRSDYAGWGDAGRRGDASTGAGVAGEHTED